MIDASSFRKSKGTQVWEHQSQSADFAVLRSEGARNALRTGAARREARDSYLALGGLRQSLRGRFTEQCARVVVGLNQSLSGRRETRPCLSSRSVCRYIAPEHRAVFAKLPH